MAVLGLSRPTVHTVCESLIQLGWVTEVQDRRPQGGRRPGRPNRCYQFNAHAGYVLGIDLGVPQHPGALKNRSATHTEHPPTVLASALGEYAVVLGATRHALHHVEAYVFDHLTIPTWTRPK